WKYFGRYVTRRIFGNDMTLYEWMTLGDKVLSAIPLFCCFLKAKRCRSSPTFAAALPRWVDTYGTEVAIRESYDTGRWSIPCYSLQCVAYDMALHYALTTTAANLHRELGL
ncbi:hypothetical protein B0H13DRAFT_1592537, partial [Mycena leptocephala]